MTLHSLFIVYTSLYKYNVYTSLYKYMVNTSLYKYIINTSLYKYIVYIYRCINTLYIHRCINTWIYTLIACRWNSKIVSVSANPDADIFAELWKEFFIVYCSIEMVLVFFFFYNNVLFVEGLKAFRRKGYRVKGKGQCLWRYVGKMTVKHKLERLKILVIGKTSSWETVAWSRFSWKEAVWIELPSHQ